MDERPELKLVLISVLNRETRDTYHLRIIAQDGGSPTKSGAMDVIVTVEDTNDNPPVFQNSSYFASISESSPIGSTVLQLHAIDKDLGPNGEVIPPYKCPFNFHFQFFVACLNVLLATPSTALLQS